MGNGLITSKNHNSWKSNRKLVTPAFHFTILKGFLSIFYQEASILADKINSRVGECTDDVYPYVALCTVDAICRTAMGVSEKLNMEMEVILLKIWKLCSRFGNKEWYKYGYKYQYYFH
ncbi:cytochrome P450 4c3-like [Lycorma delicatula]|uniref:cytochrome P450 4c3-like n=1 Tax=Lycorma delicatula TaxID=130591 RepID=UPI003F512434